MSKTILAKASLTLYAYHLRTDISMGAEQPSKDADKMWETLVVLGQTLQIPALQNLKQELICYNSEGQYEPIAENQLTFKRQSLLRSKNGELEFDLVRPIGCKDVKLNGKLYPFRLHDTYAIDLTLLCNNTIFIDKVKQLNLKELLLPQYLQASLGKTLLLYAKLAVECEDDECLENLADDYVVQLIGDKIQPQGHSKGKLLNNLIFEYETLEIEPLKRCHILIWFINKDTPTDKQLNQVSSHLLTLLCARHKILSAYNDYQSYSYEAENLYSKMESHIKELENITTNEQSNKLEERLEKFKVLLAKLLREIIDYSKYQTYAADYENTIATNIKNYELSFLKLSDSPDDNLSFLKEFLELSCYKYEAQIQIDRQYLEPGAKLFQQLIDTIRGMVAIDQAKLEVQKTEREKRLGLLITSISTGVASGLAFSSVSAAVMPKPSSNLSPPFKDSISGFEFLVDVGFHLLCGLFFAIFTGFTFWNIQNSRSQKSSVSERNIL